MVEVWKERHRSHVDVALGLQDLFAGRDSTRARNAAMVTAQALIWFNDAHDPRNQPKTPK